MKRFKILSVLLALVLGFCLAFAACAEEQGGTDETNGNNNQTSGNEDNGGSGTMKDLGEVLVVYFSATNNTEKIAGYIADITGATVFELVPKTPYTDSDLNYNNSNSRVSKEHADQSLRDIPLVSATPGNWSDYDTVFLGYPIWWGIAVWPVNGFVKSNDFTGKTVVPFCTSGGSGVGSSDTLLKNMAGTGDWKDGRRFSPSATKSDVETWINGLSL